MGQPAAVRPHQVVAAKKMDAISVSVLLFSKSFFAFAFLPDRHRFSQLFSEQREFEIELRSFRGGHSQMLAHRTMLLLTGACAKSGQALDLKYSNK